MTALPSTANLTPLPRRDATRSNTGNPIWRLDNVSVDIPGVQARFPVQNPSVDRLPVPSDFTHDDVCEKPSNTCCKEMKGEDDRHLISPEIVRDVWVSHLPLDRARLT
jgi:hypothetical protein